MDAKYICIKVAYTLKIDNIFGWKCRRRLGVSFSWERSWTFRFCLVFF